MPLRGALSRQRRPAKWSGPEGGVSKKVVTFARIPHTCLQAGTCMETDIVSGRSETGVTPTPSAPGGAAVESLPDEQLIDVFLSDRADRAEAAFRAMVVRHGPMVLGVCRHIL